MSIFDLNEGLPLYCETVFVVIGLFIMPASGIASDLPEIPQARHRSVPITIPIGCLMASECLEGSAFEAAQKSSPVTSTESAGGNLPISSVTSSDTRVFEVDAAHAATLADTLLRATRDEWLKLPRSKLLDRGPMPTGEHIIGPRPTSLESRLNAYTASEDFFDCALVFEAMRRANAGTQDDRTRSEILWDLYQRYIDSCYKGRLADLGNARARVVIFMRKEINDNYSVYCLGFNISANYILTAHHCLVEPDEVQLMLDRYKPGEPDAFIEPDTSFARRYALVIGEPDKLYALRVPEELHQNLKFFPFERDHDIVVLELDAPNRQKVDGFPVANPDEWDRISIPALFLDDKALSDPIKNNQTSAISAAIDDGSAIDISPYCSLVYSNKSKAPFVYHGCQTRYGYSGAPILKLDGRGGTVLVGVHTGSVDATHPIDGWPYATLFPNYGLRLPQLVTAISQVSKP